MTREEGANIWQSAEAAITKITKTSALHPLISCFIVFSILVVFVFLFTSPPLSIQIALVVFLGLFVLVILSTFIYFAIKNPDALRSEQYLTQRRALDLLGDEQGRFSATAHHVIAIANPNQPILPEDKMEIPKLLPEDKNSHNKKDE